MSLSDGKVNPTIGVTDMAKAKEFYEGKLGLTGGGETGDGGVDYECGGGTTLHVYPSPAAKPSGATLAAFEVNDVEATVDELIGNGVTFEQYDEGPAKTDEKGIASLGEARAAFLRDPDGNILAIADG